MDTGSLILRGEPFVPQLETSPGFIKCQIRDRWMVATPEEWVRQAVLALLKQELVTLHPHRCQILVEAKDVDITLLACAEHTDFQPPVPPIFIIETKHRGIEPLDTAMHEQQLDKYLKRTGCTHGVLINGRSTWFYQQNGCAVEKRPLLDAADLVQAILECHNTMSRQLHDEEQLFTAAQRGHFPSFQNLMVRYGRYVHATVRFRFERRGRVIEETGFMFRFIKETVQFMPRGSEQSEPSVFPVQAFRRLVAIVARA